MQDKVSQQPRNVNIAGTNSNSNMHILQPVMQGVTNCSPPHNFFNNNPNATYVYTPSSSLNSNANSNSSLNLPATAVSAPSSAPMPMQTSYRYQLPPVQNYNNTMPSQQPIYERRHSVSIGELNENNNSLNQSQNIAMLQSVPMRRSCQTTAPSTLRDSSSITLPPILPTSTGNTKNPSRGSFSDDPLGIVVYNQGERLNEYGQLIGKSGKLLRNTRRAAQNRNAQKAFRKRREQYIKNLEEKSRKFDSIVKENESLKRSIHLLKQQLNK